MHSLSTPYNTLSIKALCEKLMAKGYKVRTSSSATSLVMEDALGGKVLSAIKPTRMWSVQVSAIIAEEFSLPLWKDLQAA